MPQKLRAKYSNRQLRALGFLQQGKIETPSQIKHILICMNRRKRHILIYLYGWEKELDDREIPWVVFVRRGGGKKLREACSSLSKKEEK